MKPLLETGCYVDGARGMYAQSAVVNMAIDSGYKISQDDQQLLLKFEEDAYGVDVDMEKFDWLLEDATKWMNENLAPSGTSFGWYQGDFFLCTEDEWSNEP